MHTASWLAQGAEQLRELPVPAEVFGIGSFVLLMTLIAGVLAYGKGRPHS